MMPVILLVTRAQAGDQQAWNALIERYAPMVWCICRRYKLGGTDASDVGQTVWLHLVDQLDNIRDPAALPGWLPTTSRRECSRVLRTRSSQAVVVELDAENIPGEQTGTAEHELLAAERHVALREAFTHLPSRCQRLIAMLIEDPPVPYAKISAELGIPIGSLGPTRSRCLDRLRRHPRPHRPGQRPTQRTRATGLSRHSAAMRTISRPPKPQPYLDNPRAIIQVIGPAASRAESVIGAGGDRESCDVL